ncbi:MAG: type II toxin-antitoxin system Phd/YefM family antitoxin [Clostridiales bacterium]|jgi:antitoxin YefM|nr:type II toxin-antitoxin system Phd/YefM family antitoxin [Clostridiales bacterium]
MSVIAIKTADLTQNFKQIADSIVYNGEKVLISRPRNENLVVITEKEYNEMDKARRNAEYLAMLNESYEQAMNGEVVMYTKEQMRAMET